MKMPHSTEVPRRSQPELILNWQDWLPYLENTEICEADKQQMIEALWSLVVAFVDLGWDVQRSSRPKTCGQSLDLTAALRAAVVQSESMQHTQEEL